MKGYEDEKINKEDLVFYQYEDKKAWLGPEKVFAVNGGDVFIFANGNIRKVSRCNIQLCDRVVEIDEEEKNNTRVRFEEQDSGEKGFGDEIENKDEEEVSKRATRSMTDAKRK